MSLQVLLRAGFGVVAIVVAASDAPCQGTFSSRDAFLAADPSAVRAKLGAVALVDSIALDSIVRRDIPAVSAFYSVSPDVFWADGQGSSSHPTAGVALDRQRLAAMRKELGAPDFGDVVLFILGHEFAHMGQFRHYPLTALRDPARIKSVECQADLWAAAMMVNLLIDSTMANVPQPPDRALVARLVDTGFVRIEHAAALAYQIGTPTWDDAATHPSAMLRLGCVALGIAGGLQMREIRNYEQTHSAEVLANLRRSRVDHPQLPDVGSDLWAWTDTEANSIIEKSDPVFNSHQGPRFLDVLRTLIETAEAGQDRFRTEAAAGLPMMNCATVNVTSGVMLTCRDSLALSPKMQRDQYELYKTMVLGTVVPRSWSEQPEQVVESDASTSFISPNGKAEARVFYTKSDARYRPVFLTVLVKP